MKQGGGEDRITINESLAYADMIFVDDTARFFELVKLTEGEVAIIGAEQRERDRRKK